MADTPPENTYDDENSSTVVLLVEDDRLLSKMYLEKFEKEGIKALLAKDGAEALEIVLNKKVDVILLDIILPIMSGSDFLERLRKSPKGKSVAVVALTNLADENERKRLVELGAVEYLVKAMQTPSQVVETVKKYL